MPFRGIWQPNEFSQGLYAIQAASGRIEFNGQVQMKRFGGFGADYLRQKPRRFQGKLRQLQAKSGMVVLPSSLKQEAPLMSVLKVRTLAASSALSTSMRGWP